MATPLSFYPRPPVDTGMALHDHHWDSASPPDPYEHARNLRKAGFSWYKFLVGGTNKVGRVRIYAEHGIMPVIRMYAPRPHPNWLPNSGEVAAYVAVGGKYFEIGNEPNLVDEVQGHINPEADAAQWIRGSDIVKSVGGIPVVFACTPGGHMNHRVYTNRFLAEVKRLGRLDSFNRSVLGIHPRPLNNPPSQPRDTGNPPNTTTWLEYTWYREAYYNYLGWRIPLIATEHGYSGRGQENGEHPPMNDTTWAEWNKELFEQFNPSHPKAVPAEFLAACYWIEINEGVWIFDGPFARDGREWIGDKARPDDRSWGKAIWTIQPTWNRNLATPPVEPPIDPPDEIPETPVTRQLVRIPEYIQIVEANAPAGSEYWHLDYAELRTNEFGNNEAHNIFFDEPHDPNQYGVVEYVENEQKRFEVKLEKPRPDPAADFPIYGADYDASMKGLPSDKIKGMRMGEPVRRGHQSWWLRFSRKVKEVLVTLAQALIQAGDASQVIRFNPKAALQNAIRNGRDSNNKILVPNGTEFPLRHEGVDYVGQRAESYLTKEEVTAGILPEVYVYYAKTSNFNDVKRVKK